jgi:hypothetical protein
MSYGRFRVGILSVADYTSEHPGFCNAIEDFPTVLGPLALYDTLTNFMKPWGRHPTTGEPLFVTTVDRYTGQVTTHGVNSQGAWATPEKDSSPMATLVSAQVTNAGILSTIHAHADYFVLGVKDPDMNGDALPPALEPYSADVPMQSGHKADLSDFCINTLGLPSGGVNKWFTDNPNATPWDFANDFKEFIT